MEGGATKPSGISGGLKVRSSSGTDVSKKELSVSSEDLDLEVERVERESGVLGRRGNVSLFVLERREKREEEEEEEEGRREKEESELRAEECAEAIEWKWRRCLSLRGTVEWCIVERLLMTSNEMIDKLSKGDAKTNHR